MVTHLKPKISIITPSYNQVQYLEKTIDSVLSQNYPNLEYIIIDGGSSDGSVNIIRKYRKHLAYWVSEPDRGQSHAINKGIKIATGDVINWLNSDDFYEPKGLQKVVEFFDDPSLNCFCGRSRLFDENGTIKYSRGTDVYSGNLAKTIGWARIDQPVTFFRKSAWDTVGLLNEQLHYTMDREWWMRYLYIFGLHGIVRINEALLNFRLHEDSKTVSSKERFQIEHDSIFYILATLSKNKNFQDTISANLEIDFSLDSEIRNWTDPLIIEGSINYYLLKRAEELYYQGNHSSCRDFIKHVDTQLLAKEDVNLLNKIAARSKLPASIIKFFKKS